MTISYKLAAGLAGKDPRKCVLCGHVKRLIVEHCHAHDAVRGLVCVSCNQRLAQLDAGTKEATDAERFYLDNCPDCRRGRGDDLAAPQGVLSAHMAAIGHVAAVMRRVGWRAVTVGMVRSDFGFSRPLARAVYWSARARFDPSRLTRWRVFYANRIFDNAHRANGFHRSVFDAFTVLLNIHLEKIARLGLEFDQTTPRPDMESIIFDEIALYRRRSACDLASSVCEHYRSVKTIQVMRCLKFLNQDGKIYRSFGGYRLSPELEYRYNPRLGGHQAADQHV